MKTFLKKLKGECIGGAMTENQLFSMMEDLSFENIFLHKRFFYRNVQGYNFYSMTYSAYKSQDMVKRDIWSKTQRYDWIFKVIRNHPVFPMHGPNHHPLVPSIILSVYKNLGADISDQDILTGIDRGKIIPGAACSSLSVDGAAIGVGIAYSIIFNADPYKGRECQLVQNITKEVLEEIVLYQAPRSCQRECWIALKVASRLSEEYLAFRLPADETFICTQFRFNKEWIGKNAQYFHKILFISVGNSNYGNCVTGYLPRIRIAGLYLSNSNYER